MCCLEVGRICIVIIVILSRALYLITVGTPDMRDYFIPFACVVWRHGRRCSEAGRRGQVLLKLSITVEDIGEFSIMAWLN